MNGDLVRYRTGMATIPKVEIDGNSGVEKHRWTDCRGSGLGRGVLGNGLGALAHGVLGKLTRKHQTDSSLDLTGRQSLGLVDLRQLA